MCRIKYNQFYRTFLAKSTTFTRDRAPGAPVSLPRGAVHPEEDARWRKRSQKEFPSGSVYLPVCGIVLFLMLLTMQTRWSLIIAAISLSLFCCNAVFAQETTKQIRKRIVKEKKPAVVYVFTPS